jgi:hypothetical protein
MEPNRLCAIQGISTVCEYAVSKPINEVSGNPLVDVVRVSVDDTLAMAEVINNPFDLGDSPASGSGTTNSVATVFPVSTFRDSLSNRGFLIVGTDFICRRFFIICLITSKEA